MVAAPLSLTILRHGDTITTDLAEVDPVVPRGQIQVEESLLTEIGEELARVTTLAHTQTALDTTRAATDTGESAFAAIRRLGALIFSHLLPAAARRRLLDAAPTALFLRLDDQLVHIPWELAFDGREFLLTKFHVGRQVITQQPRFLTPPVRPPGDPQLLKMLIIVDPTETLPAASEEAEQLCDLLDTCDHLDVAVLGGKRLRKIDLLQVLNEYDLVHYAGHAFFDPEHPHRSGWVLHDSVLTASELSRLSRPPLLVFANACQAGATTRWEAGTVYEGQAFGIGSAFLLAGTQNYIGTFCVIHDAQSAAFAATFYRHFVQGERLGLALAAARRQALQDGATGGLLWASYMHYGNPAFRLPTGMTDDITTPAAAPSPAAAPAMSYAVSAPSLAQGPSEVTDTGAAPAQTVAEYLSTRSRPSAPETPVAPSAGEKRRRPWKRLLVRGVGTVFVLGVLLAAFSTQLWQGRSAQPTPLAEAYQAIEQGNWEKAERLFQQLTAAAHRRVQSQGYAGLAAVAFGQRDFRRALALAEQAEELEPEIADTRVIRGHVLLHQGQPDAAALAYRSATEKALAAPWQRAIAHNRLGQIAAAQGDAQAALSHYDQAIGAHRDMAAVYANKGYLLDKLGRRQEAVELYRQALQLSPHDPLTTLLLRDTERREQLARDTEQQQRIDALVARLAQLFREGRVPARPETARDDWVSTPVTLAFLPLQFGSTLPARAGEEEFVSLSLTQALKASGRVTVVEREFLEKFLAEIELSASGLVDPEAQLRVGKVLAARLMIKGRLTAFGEAGRLSLSLIETDSTNVLTAVTETFDTPEAFQSLLARVSATLLDAVRKEYPLQGRIASVTAEGVTVNIGARHGVTPGLMLQIFDNTTPVGLIEITAVEPQSAQGRLLQQREAVQPGWKVREQ